MLALPLIRLLPPSPRKDGEKSAGRDAGSHIEALMIGEIFNEIKLLPVLAGRRCRQADEGQRDLTGRSPASAG
jgi:hypothetical protein